MDAHNFLTPNDQENIICAIKEAEMLTSGEIRLHIENYCSIDVLDRAAAVFADLSMHKTDQRNGVLFYIAVKDHKFAVLGDVGINRQVDECFWTDVKEHIFTYFWQNKYAEGLAAGIQMAGEKLAVFFPYQADDVNELSDEISFGKD
jgi:uncharacterized membrane protein